MGEQEVVFPTLQQFLKVGERQECPLLGHCEVPGWPYTLYVVCLASSKKQQIELSTVQRMVIKILIGNINIQTKFPKTKVCMVSCSAKACLFTAVFSQLAIFTADCQPDVVAHIRECMQDPLLMLLGKLHNT